MVPTASHRTAALRTAILILATLVGALFATPETAPAKAFSNGSIDSPVVVLPDRLLHGGLPETAPIDIAFVTASDTSVDLSSLRVLVHKFFGWFDMTNRLRSDARAHISARGIHLDSGMLPAGEYEVWVSLRDMKGRLVEATGIVHILSLQAAGKSPS